MTDSIEMEKKLLGRLISNPRDYYDNHSLISSDIFSDHLNKSIYKVIESRLDSGEKVDMLILSSKVSDKDVDYRLAQCIGSDYHNYITEHMILFLSQEEKKIRLSNLINKTVSKIKNNEDLFEILNFMESELRPISDIKGSDMPDIKKQLKVLHNDIRKRMDSDEMIGIPTGFQTVDKFTGGWQETDLIIIGGASSMGKTSLGLAFCYNCSKAGIPAAVFSYEMGATQLLQRLVSLESEVNNRYIMKGTLETEELKRVDRAIGKLENTTLFIDETKDSSLRYLVNKIRQYVITKGIKFVLVDYLQLVKGEGRSREQEVALVELNITIAALSQLSRGVDRRDGSRPTMSDLRESGEIEQAADIVMLVYRPEYYGITSDEVGNSTEGLVDLIFAKGRNIGTGTLPLKFKKEFTKFSDPLDFESKVINPIESLNESF